MKRRGVSPWLIADRQRVRTAAPQGVAHRIADGETPLLAWRIETGLTIAKLDRLTGICGHDLIQMETGTLMPTIEEWEKLATALRVTVDLLRLPA